MGTRTTASNFARGAGTALVGVGGVAFGIGFGALGKVRQNRPIHSVGTVVPGTLRITAPGSVGSALFDTEGQSALIARSSRSASWPANLPDIMGLALRIPGGGPEGADADLLFASTGTGRFTRYVLQLRKRASAGPLTTMLPLNGPEGNIVFRLDPESPGHFRLSYSRNSGPWRAVGGILLEEPGEPTQRSNTPGGADDPQLRFRPVAQPPTGLSTPRWLRAVRAPSYGIARSAWNVSGE